MWQQAPDGDSAAGPAPTRAAALLEAESCASPCGSESDSCSACHYGLDEGKTGDGGAGRWPGCGRRIHAGCVRRWRVQEPWRECGDLDDDRLPGELGDEEQGLFPKPEPRSHSRVPAYPCLLPPASPHLPVSVLAAQQAGAPLVEHGAVCDDSADTSGHISTSRIIGALLPVAYVWSLPLLGALGFAHVCPGWPRCDAKGASVSSYIANAHATGAMAACFFYPALHLWMNANKVRNDRFVYPSLVVFQGCFGLFLMCPVNEAPKLHILSVDVFCISALVHYGMMLRHCANERLRLCQLFLCVALSSFLMVFILAWIARLNGRFLVDRCPLLFYVAECTGLSAMAVFPTLWHRERSRAGRRQAVSLSAPARALVREWSLDTQDA